MVLAEKISIHRMQKAFSRLAIDAMEKGYAEKPFDYYGVVPGDPEKALKPVIEPQYGDVYKSGLIDVPNGC